jgi:hypothetical protein
MQSHDNTVEITPEDVGRLCAMNPLAAEQLKNIALQRRLVELEQTLSAGSAEDISGEAVSRDTTDPEERQ